MSGSKLESRSSLLLPVARGGGRAFALTSALALLACEDKYITQTYYILPDASAVTADDRDAGSVDAGSEATETDTETHGGRDATADTDTESDTETSVDTSDPEDAGAQPDVSEPLPPEVDAGDAGWVDPHAGNPFYAGAPRANTDAESFDVDVFGDVGNRYWFATDPNQAAQMSGGQNGDIYEPRPGGDKTYVESLFVTTPDGRTADFGQLSVHIIGGSTLRPWTPTTIPNLRLDMDYFTQGLRLDGYEHLRLNNNLVGSIFRERVTLELYRKLGYPAPRAQYAWVGSNIWGDAWIPYTMVQVYKKSFCAEYAEQWGGGCENMWEFYGDFGGGVFDVPESCQSDECENTRVLELEQAVVNAPYGEGFKAALEGWIDWDAYHEFQCLSWILSVPDDAIHSNNNVLLVERSDGLFQYLPYSTDISLGQDWFSDVPLAGQNSISQGCQNDPSCWADTVAVCENLVDAFSDLNPGSVLDERYTELEDNGMLRQGDEERYELLATWFETREEQLRAGLEGYREDPYACPPGQIDCDGYCSFPQDCWLCQSGEQPFFLLPADNGEAAPAIAIAPIDGDAGVGPVDPDAGVPVEEPGLPDFCYP